MKTLFVLAFCLCAVLCSASSGTPDYNLSVHVTASRMARDEGSIGYHQYLVVVIDGKKYEFQSVSYPNSLLQLGDYKARIVEDRHGEGDFDLRRVYELSLPNQKTRKFLLIGVSE